MTKVGLEDAFQQVLRAALEAQWPGIERGTSYGTPALKVRGKLMARLKDAETLVVRCPLEDKEFLVGAEPEVFFETDHYRGWPLILVRLSRVDPARLRQRLEVAWRMQASKRLIASFDQGR